MQTVFVSLQTAAAAAAASHGGQTEATNDRVPCRAKHALRAPIVTNTKANAPFLEMVRKLERSVET